MAITKLRIIHFDVSQGESTLISLLSPTGDVHVLIDGGRLCRGKYVVRCLERMGITRLAYVVCTHLDQDHHEGLVPVVSSEHIATGKLLVPKFGYNHSKFDALRLACEKGKVAWGIAKVGDKLINKANCKLKVVHVGTPSLKDDNLASIGCLLTMNSFSYYTAGDLPSTLEDKLSLGDHVCAFKCGHHGAEGSTSSTFVGSIAPTAAFISAGRHVHGHPRQAVVEALCKEPSLQRFYSTNCLPQRTGFLGKNHPNYESKGIVASQRSEGVLGHLILYTDHLLSLRHDSSKVNFYTLCPPRTEHQTVWTAYKHVCGNIKHRPRGAAPQGLVHLKADEYPEFRLSELSDSIQAMKKSKQEDEDEDESVEEKPFLDFKALQLLEKLERNRYVEPRSPIIQFLEDTDNFVVDTSTKSNEKKRKVEVLYEREHPNERKRTSGCIGCMGPDGELVACSHNQLWLVCEDCKELYPEGFDCGA